MARRVADQLAQTLEAAGIERVWGHRVILLNGFTEALRTTRIRWMHVRHEEVAAFAAGAEAQMTGKLAVCAGSCGPGNLHLINGLFDCHRNRVPVLAIAAQIPSPEIGGGYFQETHPEILFRECSHYCELMPAPAQMPRVLEIAMRTAIERAASQSSCCPATWLREAESNQAARWTAVLAPTDRVTAGDRDRPPRTAAQRHRTRDAAVRRRMCGCARSDSQAGRRGESTDRPHPARQGIHRARQSVRCRHDRADRVPRPATTRCSIAICC